MAAPRSFARLIRSSSVIGMIVPLSSTIAAAGQGSAPNAPRQNITQEDMDDLAAYLSSLSGQGMPQGGGAARLFLVAVPPGRGSPIAVPEQPGTASAARPPTEEEKRAFQFMKFDLQRKLSAASSRNGYLTLMQIITEAESSMNEDKSRSVEECQQELRKSTEVYERRAAEDRKVDQILSILLEVKRASSASGGSFEKVDIKVDQILSIVLKNQKSSSTNGSSSEEADHTSGPEWNLANCSSDKVSCKIYHFVVRDGRRHLRTIGGYVSKIDRHLTSGIKYYLLALPFAVWLSMGLSVGEMRDLLMLRHQKMSKECKQEVVEYRKVQADEKEAKEKGVTVEDLLEVRKVSAEEAERKKLAAAAADAAETLRKKTAAEYTDKKEAAEAIDRKEAAEAGVTEEAAAAETPSAGMMKGLLGWLKIW